MPIYVYRCRPCAQSWEQRRPMAEATEPATCPLCGLDTPPVIAAASVPPEGTLSHKAK